MLLTDEELHELIAACHDEFGREISLEEARSAAQSLISLLTVLSELLPSEKE